MAYNHLSNMLKTIETKLNNTSSNNNYYESRIKQDLSYFKDQTHNKSFYDSFANGSENKLNNQSTAQGIAYISNTSPEVNDEIRRTIKREIEPFIFSIKNELNITMDAFRKEIESYTDFKPDIDECKDIASENANFIRAAQEENEKKIAKSNQRLQSVTKQIEQIRSMSNDSSRRMDELEKVFLGFNDKFVEFNNVKAQLQNIDNSLGSIYKEIEESLSNKLSTKYINLETQGVNQAKEFSSLKTQMTTLSINQSQLEENINEKQKNTNALYSELNDVKLRTNSTLVLLNDTKNKIENINSYNQTLETKVSNFNKQILSQNDNISTVQLGFKALAGEYMQLKTQFSGIYEQSVKDQSHRVMFQNEIETISSSVKMQNEKILKLASQVNESINISDSVLYSSMIEKINKCQMNIDEVSDVSNGKIASINGKISELSMNLKDLFASKRQHGIIMEQSPQQLHMTTNLNRLEDDDEFKAEQIKFNNLHEMTLNEISNQIISIDKELKLIKQDIESHEDNFTKIQGNFIKINPQLDKIALFPELIKTLSANHSTLQEEVQKGFNTMTKWQNDLVANIDKTVSNVKSEFDTQLQMIKISNTMNRANVDSQRSDIEKETIASNLALENSNKLKIDKVKTRCDGIDQRLNDIEAIKIPQAYNYIDNTIKNLLEPKSFSENRDNNNYIDQLLYVPNSMRLIDASSNLNNQHQDQQGYATEEKGLDDENDGKNEEKGKEKSQKKALTPKLSSHEEINAYSSGYVTNNLQGTILRGDGLEASSKQIDTIEGKLKMKTSIKSSKNSIELYLPRNGSSQKRKKNEMYLSMQPADLIQNESLFPNTYLKNFMTPRANLENILEIEFDGNSEGEGEGEEEGEQQGNNGGGSYQNTNNALTGQSLEQPNKKQNSLEDFDDDFDN